MSSDDGRSVAVVQRISGVVVLLAVPVVALLVIGGLLAFASLAISMSCSR